MPAPAPAVDLDEERLADLVMQLQDAALVAATLQVFLRELPGRCAAITEAAGRRDRAGVEGDAHTLRSACALFGVATLADLCGQLEAQAKDGDWAQLHRLAAAVKPAAARADAAAQLYLARGPARV